MLGPRRGRADHPDAQGAAETSVSRARPRWRCCRPRRTRRTLRCCPRRRPRSPSPRPRRSPTLPGSAVPPRRRSCCGSASWEWGWRGPDRRRRCGSGETRVGCSSCRRRPRSEAPSPSKSKTALPVMAREFSVVDLDHSAVPSPSCTTHAERPATPSSGSPTRLCRNQRTGTDGDD